MDKDKTTTETNVPPIVTEDSASDAETRIADLEKEKVKLVGERANYQIAYLKEKEKNKNKGSESSEDFEEEKLRRIVREETANSRIAQIDTEKDTLVKNLLKENKELKLAHLNKTSVSSTRSSSTETSGVRDTMVTPEQEQYFRNNLKWTDKDIETYKKRLVKQGVR